MNACLRSITVLAFAIGGTFLAACDSDDPAETDLVIFEGVYAVEGRFDGTAARDGAGARGGADALGTCCFRLEIDMDNGSTGNVSGDGTLTYLNEDGTEADEVPVRSVFVGGTTTGDAVALTLDFNVGGETLFTLTFEGTVEEDGSSITGTFDGVILDGQTLTLVRGA